MSKNKTKKPALGMDISIGGINPTTRALLAKHLAVMQKAGLTITESLDIIEDSATGRMKNVIRKVLASVKSGNTLSESMSRYPKVFSGIFVSSVYAGETSGTLDQNLENLAEQLEKEKELISKVKGAMLYPIVVLVAAFVLGIAMSFFVLPKIIPLFEGLKTELPITTLWLIRFSHFVSDHGTGLFLGIVAFVVFFVWLIKQKFVHPVTHLFLLHVPILKSISRNSNLARFARTLGTLLKSGLSIDEALEVTEKSLENYYYQRALLKVRKRISRGSTLSENLQAYHKLFPKMTAKMILVGEQSGKLEDTLLYLANFYEVEVDNSTKSLSTAIEPILLIFIGLVVGFLALSIITPIYNITGNIRG
ncbi:MAG: type II secretion system F family protein [Candidatus Magasanikbacteria bacterium]|nr:type II secretion system F family protein [Candidatus Magasanikbacteria bacterium]MBT6819471.1 type II secretion system F family protein [Candidatus Magasanikbacteria bacterium]